MQRQRTITVFLASSDELINDRNSFQALIASLDDIYEERGIRIKCKRWEDFGAYCTGERTQDQYNKVVRASDLCICMFHRKAGKYTIEEFNQALNEYRQSGDHPKTYVYIRALVEGEIEEEELKTFKADLFQSIGHYWCNYVTDDAMKLHFVMQLERLMTPSLGSAESQSTNLKVEDGNVLLHGRKIADYSNLSFAACNTDYTALKAKIEGLDKEIVQFRAMNIAELQSIILAKSAERNQCYEDLKKLEEQLFSIALSVNKMISSGAPVSERKRMAIEMFEKGNIRGVIDVLNENDMSADAECAKAEIERGKQLIEAGNEMVESGVLKIRSLVEEYTVKAKALMAEHTEPDRFQLAFQAYEQAVALSREHLTMEELASILFDTACFLQNNNVFHVAEKYYLESYDLYHSLSVDGYGTYNSYVAKIFNNLAILYRRLNRFTDGELMYKKSLTIYQQLSVDNPIVYDTYVATTLNNLAALYCRMQRFSESEFFYKEALKIRRRLSVDSIVSYESDIARTLNNLAILYRKTHRYIECELRYKEALEIHSRLSVNKPNYNRSAIATIFNNLANLYSDTHRYIESELMYKKALEIRRRLSVNNPQTYEPYVSTTLHNLASLYCKNNRFYDSELMYKEALQIRRRLAVNNPKAFRPYVVYTLSSMAFNRVLIRDFIQAEKWAREGLDIDSSQVIIYKILAVSLLLQGKYEEAEQIYLQYRDDLKESFIEDIEKFDKMEIIPEEHKKEVEKIKRILIGGDDSADSN